MLSRILSAGSWLYSSISFFELATSVICIAIHMKMHPICLKAGKPWKLLSATAYWRDSSRIICSRNTLHCGISLTFTWAKHARWSNKCGDTSTPSFPPYTTSRRVVTSKKYPSISDIRADFVGFGMGSLGNLPHIQHDLLLLPMPGHHKLPRAMQHWSL